MEGHGTIRFELYRVFYVTTKCGNITQADRGIAAGRMRRSLLVQLLPKRNACPLTHRDRLPGAAARTFAENILASKPMG